MNEVQAVPVEDLEELLDKEVPCGGNNYPSRSQCGQSAQLYSRVHNCHPPRSFNFKCINHWQTWYKAVAADLASQGYLCCNRCSRRFSSVEAFSDYRPF